MTVGDIWTYVLEMSLRDNGGGYLRPDVFNSIIQHVNTDLFNREYKKYEEKQVITDSLAPFVVTLGDSDQTFLDITDGYVTLPSDYRHMSSFRLISFTNDDEGRCKKVLRRSKPGVMLNDDQFNYRRDSQLHKPSFQRPIGTIQNATTSQSKLRVLPDDVGYKVGLTYLKLPSTPVFDYKILNPTGEDYIEYLAPDQLHDGTVLTNGTASRSVELEWPEQVHTLFQDMVYKEAMLRLESGRYAAINDNR